MALPHNDSEIPQILKILKTLLKSKGVLYKNIADELGVSETTIKRYLTGHNLTLEILERLARFIGMRLSDITDLATEKTENFRQLQHDSEEALAREPFLAALFHLIARGFNPATLQRDFSIDAAEMNRFLTTLDRLGLIQLFPNNRVRVTASKHFDVERGGPLTRLAQETILNEVFQKFDVASPNWVMSYTKLSPASIERVREMMRDMVIAFDALGKADRDLPADLSQWKGLFLTLHPVDIGKLRDWPGTPPPKP